MPTSQLIIRFYSDLLKQQKDESDGEGKLGELILSVGYARETSMVEVSVVHGDNIGELSYTLMSTVFLSVSCDVM